MQKKSIALLGLGLMGSGMARNLLAGGHPLTVYNRSSEKAQLLAEAGARVADSPRLAAAGAEIVISMVADDAASRSVWIGDDGVFSGETSGALFIESSTISVGWVRELAALAAERGCELLDAPVTGSRAQAEGGELLFLVGGSEVALERGRPVLSEMSRDIVYIGPSGSGALIKLINNFLCGVQAASLAEALALIETGGLDRSRALDVLLNGAPASPIIRTLAARMLERDYSPNFTLQLMMKDLGYANREGEINGVPLTMARAALEVFDRAFATGAGDEDMSAVVEQFRQK